MITAMQISHYRTNPVKLMIEADNRSGENMLLMRAAAMDAGCCLDAPSQIPAGACYWVPVDEDGFPEQITIERDVL